MLTQLVICFAVLSADDVTRPSEAADSAPPYRVGSRIVVIRPTQLTADNRAIGQLEPGTTVDVEEIRDGFLGVTAGRQGWVDQNDVAPAEKAVAALAPALANDPDKVQLREIRLRFASWREDWDAAITDSTALIRLEPSEPGHYFERAYACSRKGEYDKAIADCDEVIRRNWHLATALLERGYLWQCKDQLDKAINDFDAALKHEASDHTKSQIYLYRGMAHREREDWESALSDFNSATKLTWSNRRIFLERTSVQVHLRHRDEAINDYSAALFLNSKDATVYAYRADQYTAKKQFDKAQADVAYALTIEPKSCTALCARGYLHNAQKQFEEAVADFTEALTINPGYSYAMGFRAECYLDVKDYAKARDGYLEAQKLDPNDYRPLSGLAWIYGSCADEHFRDGRLAVEYATKSAQLTKQNRADVLNTLAVAYAEDGRYDLALNSEEEALSLEHDEKLQERYHDRIELFKQHQPYRFMPPGERYDDE